MSNYYVPGVMLMHYRFHGPCLQKPTIQDKTTNNTRHGHIDSAIQTEGQVQNL